MHMYIFSENQQIGTNIKRNNSNNVLMILSFLIMTLLWTNLWAWKDEVKVESSQFWQNYGQNRTWNILDNWALWKFEFSFNNSCNVHQNKLHNLYEKQRKPRAYAYFPTQFTDGLCTKILFSTHGNYKIWHGQYRFLLALLLWTLLSHLFQHRFVVGTAW